MNGLEWINQAESVRVRQQIEVGEILTGFQVRNRYVIDDGNERVVLRAEEVANGAGGFVARQFFKGNRPFTVQVFDAHNEVVLEVVRRWTLFFARARVSDGRGNALGVLQQRWAWFRRRYTLEDPYGRELAELHGPFFRPWTFQIQVRGKVNGFIRKKWSGLGKEAFTAADNFAVELGPSLDGVQRALCVAATLLIDYVHFERR